MINSGEASRDRSDASSAYDDWHARLGVDAEANAPWHMLVRENLDPARDLVERAVLEIGCGRGGFSCWLSATSKGRADLIAADFSRTAVQKGAAFADEHGLAGIMWEVGDIQHLAHADASFDSVISCETIEHVPDPALAVRELARVLKPNGWLFLTTPNYLSPTGLYRGYLRLLGRRFQEEGQPINNFNMLPRTISWVKRAGLRVRKVDGTGHYLPFPGRPPIHFERLEQPRVLMRWLALHSLVVAQKSA